MRKDISVNLLIVRGIIVTWIVACLVILLWRNGRRWHPVGMTIGIVTDLILFLVVVIAREPLQKTFGGGSGLHDKTGLIIHIGTAIGLLACYVLAWRLGRKVVTARKLSQPIDLSQHRMVGIATILFLIVNYMTTPGFVFDWATP